MYMAGFHLENSPRGAFGDTDDLKGESVEVCVQACTKVGSSGGSPMKCLMFGLF